MSRTNIKKAEGQVARGWGNTGIIFGATAAAAIAGHFIFRSRWGKESLHMVSGAVASSVSQEIKLRGKKTLPPSQTVTAAYDRASANMGMSKRPELRVTDEDGFMAMTTVSVLSRQRLYISNGLAQQSDATDLEAELTHELSHVDNHDKAVLQAYNLVLMLLTKTLIMPAANRLAKKNRALGWAASGAAIVISQALTRVLMRTRESMADARAAKALGSPDALISSLRNTAGTYGEDQGPLSALFASHQATADRIRTLQALAE